MNRIIHGDSAQQLINLESQSVDLVVTSPPYDGMRSKYGNTKLDWNFEGTASQLYRVMTNGGIICWNVADEVIEGGESLTSCKQKLYFAAIGFRIHDTMIYQKLNFSNPEKTRYHQVFEYVFIVSKGPPRCFNPIKDRPNKTAGLIGSLGVNSVTQRDGGKAVRARKVNSALGMRHNVWLGKTRGQEEMCKKLPRTAMMPKWLARDLIISWSNVGDTVLDPFAGSGTTLIEASKLGRKFIGIDNDTTAMPALSRIVG